MMKWEYCSNRVPTNYLARTDLFNRYGSDGWELVSVDNGIAYFKKPNAEWVKDKAREEMRKVTFTGYKIDYGDQ